MSSESHRKRIREEDRHNRHNRSGSEIGSNERDTEVDKLRHYLSRSEKKLKECIHENEELKGKVHDLEACCRKRKRQYLAKTEEMTRDGEKKSRGIHEYIQTTTAAKQILEKEKCDALAKAEEMRKQLAEQQVVNQRHMSKIDNILKTVSEHDSTIKRLTAEKNNAIENNTQKDKKIEALMKDLDSAEKEMNQYMYISSKLKKYFDENEDYKLLNETLRQQLAERNTGKCGPDCQQAKTEIQRLNNEIHSLKQQRKYFEDHNNLHKQKVLAVSHTAIEQQKLYANAVREVHINSSNIADKVVGEVTERVTEILKDVPNVITRQLTEKLAETVNNIGDGIQDITESRRKMEEKRKDGRVACGSCDKTFLTPAALKQHMTLAHDMNTTDLTKNKVEVIQID